MGEGNGDRIMPVIMPVPKDADYVLLRDESRHPLDRYATCKIEVDHDFVFTAHKCDIHDILVWPATPSKMKTMAAMDSRVSGKIN